MGEFVAVVDPFALVKSQTLSTEMFKHLAVLFDRIGVMLTAEWLSKDHPDIPPEVINELRWLFEKGILFEPDLDTDRKEWGQQLTDAFESGVVHAVNLINIIFGADIRALEKSPPSKKKSRLISRKLANFQKTPFDEMIKRLNTKEFAENIFSLSSSFARVNALHLREKKHIDAYPILPIQIPELGIVQSGYSDIIQKNVNTTFRYLSANDETLHQAASILDAVQRE